MKALIAKKDFTYNHKPLKRGASFSAPEKHAKALVAIGRASYDTASRAPKTRKQGKGDTKWIATFQPVKKEAAAPAGATTTVAATTGTQVTGVTQDKTVAKSGEKTQK